MREYHEEIAAANEALFHAAWKWIVEQGHASTESGHCVYQGSHGGCAFSPAIRDYDEDLEDNSASDLIEMHPGRLHDWAFYVDSDFADSVQNCHDEYATTAKSDYEFLDKFKTSMRGLAVDENIDLYLREQA